MSRAPTRRPLGTFETALTLTGRHAPFVVVVVLELDGGPPLPRLRAALDALQRRHPLLAVRIAEESGRFRFETDGVPPIPLTLLQRSGDALWTRVAEAELGRPLDEEAGPLARCTYLAPAGADGRAEIVLTFHHAVIDGASAQALAGELLDLCAPEGAAGASADGPGPAPPLPPVEDLFPAGFRGARGLSRQAAFVARQMADEVVYRWRTRAARARPPDEPVRCRVLPVRLEADATAELVRRSRQERVTLHGALSAAFLLAAQRHLHGGRAGPLRHVTFADLRPYLRPPVPPERLGCCISMLRHTVEMPPGDEGRARFWPLARRIDRQVTAGLRRGDRLTAVLLAERMMRAVLGQPQHRMDHRLGTTALSYAGPVRIAGRGGSGTAPGSPVLRGLHGFISNLAVGPEYTAQASLFGGELLLDIVYLDADMDRALAERIAGEVLATLRAAGRPEEARS